MVILSPKILGNQLVNVALKHADILCNKHGINKTELNSKLNSCKSIEEFKTEFDKYFGNEIRLYIK